MTHTTTVPGDVTVVLLAMTYLLIKHLFADFLLQTEIQRRTKGNYGAGGGLAHALTHIVLTAPVFFILPAIGAGPVALLLAGEFALHYHIDWTKEQLLRRNNWALTDQAFWWALGIDQLAHGLTYVALIWLAFFLATGSTAL